MLNPFITLFLAANSLAELGSNIYNYLYQAAGLWLTVFGIIAIFVGAGLMAWAIFISHRQGQPWAGKLITGFCLLMFGVFLSGGLTALGALISGGSTGSNIVKEVISGGK